jgi:hypothetical protein
MFSEIKRNTMTLLEREFLINIEMAERITLTSESDLKDSLFMQELKENVTDMVDNFSPKEVKEKLLSPHQ